jgi:DNA-binding PadR family transcriptional regulator
MSIRDGILAVLREDEVYGLQLHTELESRTERPGRINVGQIYSTLERLVAAGLVHTTGATDDGLPLYGLTDEGTQTAERWLGEATVHGSAPWGDMVFKVLLATSLHGADAGGLLEGYRRCWSAELADAGSAGGARSPGDLSRLRLAEAALAWLDDVEGPPGGLPTPRGPLRNERPRRGRRPSTPQE